MPLWFGVLMSTASEVNEAGVVVYGVMLMFLAPACAYVTSRRLGPSALRASWPWRAPWAGVAWVTIISAAIAGGWVAYYVRLNQGGGGTFGVLLWYLTAMLGPPIVAGCLVHLLADTATRRRSAG